MPFNHRMRVFDAINNSSIHQSLATVSSQAAIQRCQSNILTDPARTLETLRSLIQPEINKRIQRVISEICETHFKPAIFNMKQNLGEENVNCCLLEDICISVLENAKEIYRSESKKLVASRGKSINQVLKRSTSSGSVNSPSPKKSLVIKSGMGRPNTDLILVNKAGRPVRREGAKWEPDRLRDDTLFILGSRANKALGFGQTRGRLYIKHPELFKYSGDQADKEWLAKANLMATTGGKAYLMVLQDILDLAESPEYSSHPKQQPGELVGFTVPNWMIEKMKAYIETAKTNPETTDEELIRMAEEYAEMEEEGRKWRRKEDEESEEDGKKLKRKEEDEDDEGRNVVKLEDDDDMDEQLMVGRKVVLVQHPATNTHHSIIRTSNQVDQMSLYKLIGETSSSNPSTTAAEMEQILLDDIKRENNVDQNLRSLSAVKNEMDITDEKPKLEDIIITNTSTNMMTGSNSGGLVNTSSNVDGLVNPSNSGLINPSNSGLVNPSSNGLVNSSNSGLVNSNKEEELLDESHQQTQHEDDELSLDKLIGEGSDETAPNVAQLLQEIKHENVDDDLQNLDTGFLQGMNLHNLVREFEMETGGGSELNLLALADDTLNSLH